MNDTEKAIDILRAHAIAGALRNARPSDYLTNHPKREAWYACVNHIIPIVCSRYGMPIDTFCDLCGVPK